MLPVIFVNNSLGSSKTDAAYKTVKLTRTAVLSQKTLTVIPMYIVRLLTFTTLTLLFGCATPTQKADELAANSGFVRIVLPGQLFNHVAYFSPGKTSSNTLHVYLEGDGSPWLTPKLISIDPTPRKPLMLKLMRQDSQPALYLGRPCYFSLPNEANCTPTIWTDGRYGAEVVTSLERALRNFLTQSRLRPPIAKNATYDRIGLFGHSGGGTLVMLLAPRIAQTYAVATIAANLDINAWTSYRGFSPLRQSINPAQQPALPRYIRQIHWAGALDRNIPPALIAPIVAKQYNAIWRIDNNNNHDKDWREPWNWTLSQLKLCRENETCNDLDAD